jgi:NAD(P)-dependent dehydrogenase (short-subunit alcohol dehydrogenase family)
LVTEPSTETENASPPAMRFEGQVCLVTGGARGIGLAIAAALALEGALVGVMSRNEEECLAAASSIGDSAVGLPGDVTDEKACAGVVSTLTKQFGRPQVLINAAGISPIHGRAEEHGPDSFAQVVRTNLIGAYCMTRAVSESMLADESGSIVMIASALGLAASPRLAAYGSSKAGLIQLTRTLAKEWGGRRVRVNALCPGYVPTAMTEQLLQNSRLYDRIVRATPLGRVGSLPEIVHPALFIASPEASFITGAVLAVDGGLSA